MSMSDLTEETKRTKRAKLTCGCVVHEKMGDSLRISKYEHL